MKKQSGIIVTSKQAASFFDVTTKTIRQWSLDGSPKVKQNTYDLKALFDWWWKTKAGERALSDYSDDSEARSRERYWQAKAEEKKMQVEEKKGNLIDKSVRDKAEFSTGVLIRDAILNIPDRLSPILAAEAEAEKVNRMLMKELRAALTELSEMGE